MAMVSPISSREVGSWDRLALKALRDAASAELARSSVASAFPGTQASSRHASQLAFAVREVVPSGTVPDIAVICEDYVAIDGTLDLTTDDGRLAESLSLTFQSATGLEVTARSELDPAGLSGSLVFDDFVRSTDYDERSMWVDALFDATGSHGRVEGQVTGGDDCQDGDVCTQWAEVVDLGSWGYELD